MARRGGFFAELQRQAEAAAREQAKQARQEERANNAAIRAAEQARKAAERAAAQMERTNAAEAKRLAKEAKEAHLAAMNAEVERRNSELQKMYEEIDSLLPIALGVDMCIDLASLHADAVHPLFDRADLEAPVPAPDPIPDPVEPVFVAPEPPKGLFAAFGKKAHEQAVAEATSAHERAVQDWKAQLHQAQQAREVAQSQWAAKDASRIEALEAERARYVAECSAREAEAAERNAALDQLSANLGYGTADAVEEYLSIVFSRSPYPAAFPVEHQIQFDGQTAELSLRVLVPGPDKVATISGYKYVKASDEIATSSLSQKACKDRYAAAVHQVALRSLYEVFTSDPRGLIKTVSLEVGTETIDPATGKEAYVPFVAAGVARDLFMDFDLSNVVPASTLSHLGAAVSKNPYDLAPVSGAGIRRS